MKNSAKLNLTTLELKALAAAYRSSDETAHDFGIVGDVVAMLAKDGIKAQAAGALMVSLQAKGLFRIHGAVVVNEGTRDADRIVQFVFTPEALATCESLKAEAEAAKWLEAERARTLETVIVRVDGLGMNGSGWMNYTLDAAQRMVARITRADVLARWQAGIATALAPLHAEALLLEAARLRQFAHEEHLAAADAKRDGHFSDALLLSGGARRTLAKADAIESAAEFVDLEALHTEAEVEDRKREAIEALNKAGWALFRASCVLESLNLEAECVAVTKHAVALNKIRVALGGETTEL